MAVREERVERNLVRFVPENIAPDGKAFHSKSELIIYLMLLSQLGDRIEFDVNFWYERRIFNLRTGSSQYPDFVFSNGARGLLLWEHLGMVGSSKYDVNWAHKAKWYEANGYSEWHENLITTKDYESKHRRGATYIDCEAVTRRIKTVEEWLAS
jgi:hypothetical protein